MQREGTSVPIGTLKKTKLALVAVSSVAVLAISACGSDGNTAGGGEPSGESVSVDVGLDKPIVVKTKKPRIAWFGAVANLYVQAQQKGMQDRAKELGLEFTTFDSKFDPLVQMQQIQNAIQSKKFDAFVVDPFDGNALCPVLTKDAVEAGIVVVTAAVTMCDHVKVDEGDDAWAPGTLAQIGYQGGVGAVRQFLAEVNERAGTGKHETIALLGPELNASSIAFVEAIKQSEESGAIPNLDIKHQVYTDFSTAQGLSKVQALLQANPGIDTIVSLYSDVTMGAIGAVEKAGAADKVKIYDQGGSSQSVQAVRDGKLVFTTAFHPYRLGEESIQIIFDAFSGKTGLPRFSGGYLPNEGPGNHTIIDESNAADWEPEY